VAYVRNGDIWVRQSDGGGNAIPITDGGDDSSPEFSPDCTQIAFRSERGGGGIYVAPALGGEARELAPQGRRPRFSPDGRSLMYWTGPGNVNDLLGSRQVKLFVQSLSDGTVTPVGAGCGVMERTPVWSPDSSRILFVGVCGSDGISAWVSTIDGKELRPNRDLYAVWPTIQYYKSVGQWIPDPPRLLIPLPVADATYVAAVPLSEDGTRVTGPVQRLASLTDGVTRVSAAWNGRMAISASAQTGHIWSLPIDATGRATGEPVQLTYGSAGESGASLSRDGEKLAFTSKRANRNRLFYRDLATGREKELSTNGYRYGGAFFSSDGSGIMGGVEPDRRSLRRAIYYMPISGGLPKTIGDTSFAVLFAWSPDSRTLLIIDPGDHPASDAFEGHTVKQLDIDTLSTTVFLDDPELEIWPHQFSKEARWVAFNATKDRKSSHIYIAPFRKALVPRSEWIPIAGGDWDDKPHFSYDDTRLFFVSGKEAPRRLMAQSLGSDMRPDGKPVVVYPQGQSKSSPDISNGEISVGPRRIVFGHDEAAGDIWLLEPAKAISR
jgi:Tol biopolymer transport system component